MKSDAFAAMFLASQCRAIQHHRVRREHVVAALLAGAGALVSSTAGAQTNRGGASDSLEEVVITGSRVITNGNNSPTPVTVVDAQNLLTVNPGTISEALSILPVFSGSNGQLSNPNGGIGAGGGGNGVSSRLNLRNMGVARTLVLLDGKRVPPTTANGVVDTDMIPQMLLKRVDVVTGGVSAVYGSDAITGVVNFITDRDFNGLKMEAQYGISEQGDGQEYSAGVAGGLPLGSRAHFVGSYEYRRDEGVLFRSSRPENHLCGVLGLGTTQFPYLLTCDARRSDVSFGGRINSGTLINQQFVSVGVLGAFTNGTNVGNSNLQIGGDGAYPDGSLRAPLVAHQLFGRVDYDFTDTLHGYFQFAGNQKLNEIYGGWQNLNNVTISRDNAFLAQTYRNQLIGANQTTFTFGKFDRQSERTHQEIDETQMVFQTALEGKLGDYDWDLAYVHGSAVLENNSVSNQNNLKLSAALDAVRQDPNNPNSPIVCRVAVTNPGAFPGCVPLHVFGEGAESQAARDYIHATTLYKATTVQDDVSASISGAPFDTWAGPFKAALSGEWRRQTYRSTSTSPPADPANPVDCVGLGLRLNCGVATSVFGNTFANRSKVAQEVMEGAVEFDAPLLAGLSLVKSLNLNGAVRYTNYDTSGNYTTWKAGLDWHVNDSLRFRGTRSRDIRAPTLDDLFAPSVGTGQSVQDLLFNPTITSNATRFESGNPNVTAEIGNTTTFGVVYQPEALPGFSVSLDAFDIVVDNALSSISGTQQPVQRACYDSGGTSPYCQLQERALGHFNPVPGNIVTRWYTRSVNIAEVHTWGGDLELNYSTRIGANPLTLRAMVTYQPHIKYDTPGLAPVDQGGVVFGPGGLQASPKTRLSFLVRYSPFENFSFDVFTRWRSKLALVGDATLVTSGQVVPSVSYTNLNFNYRIPQQAGNLDVYVNIQDVFDKGAPPANFYGTQANVGLFGGFANGDSPIGRSYTAGLRYRF